MGGVQCGVGREHLLGGIALLDDGRCGWGCREHGIGRVGGGGAMGGMAAWRGVHAVGAAVGAAGVVQGVLARRILPHPGGFCMVVLWGSNVGFSCRFGASGRLARGVPVSMGYWGKFSPFYFVNLFYEFIYST